MQRSTSGKSPPWYQTAQKVVQGMKKKVNPGILPGFANLTHSKILTSSELDDYMESESWMWNWHVKWAMLAFVGKDSNDV